MKIVHGASHYRKEGGGQVEGSSCRKVASRRDQASGRRPKV